MKRMLFFTDGPLAHVLSLGTDPRMAAFMAATARLDALDRRSTR